MNSSDINLRNLISQAGRHLRSEFEEIKLGNPHYAERGAETEIILRDFLNTHLPKRYLAEMGIVIDSEDKISKQMDIIIYDALNSPVYRKGPRVSIIQSDNVASIIEVKSKLNKDELVDAAEKIASVKSLKKSPLTNVDQPVTMSDLIVTQTLGVVFAYDSSTSLETLAKNLQEVNSKYPSNHWIDIVVVLDKGIIGYTLQKLFEENFAGWFSQAIPDDFVIPPFFIHLVTEELGELTLNKFFFQLVTHLTFFRKKSTVSFERLMGRQSTECRTVCAYQFNLKRKLVDVEEFHQAGKFNGPKLRYNLFAKNDKKFNGQIGWIPWQDGAVISYSGRINPMIIFGSYFKNINQKLLFIRVYEDADFWISPVIPISQDKFVSITETLSNDIYIEKDTHQDDDFSWLKNSFGIK